MKSKNVSAGVGGLFSMLSDDLKDVLVEGKTTLHVVQGDRVALDFSTSEGKSQMFLEYLPTESEYKLVKVSVESASLPRKTLELVMPLPEFIEDGLKPIIELGESSLSSLIHQFKNMFWSEYSWTKDYGVITTHLLRDNLFPKDKIEELFAYKLFTQKFLEQTFSDTFGSCEIDHLWYEVNPNEGSILCTFVNSSKVAFKFKQEADKEDVFLETVTGIDTASIVLSEMKFLESGLSSNLNVNELIDFRPYLKIK